MSTDGLRYDSVIFDVGGTMLGFFDWRPFRQFLADVGLPATEDDGHRLHDSFRRIIVDERDQAQGLGADDASLNNWWRGIFRKLWPDRPDVAEGMFRAFRADQFDRVFPDVVPTLEALRGLGLPLGVLSNFTTDLDRLLDHLGLSGYFGFVIVSARVGLAKPDPRIFDLAVAAAGRPRHRLLYVGDHVGDDVEGAQGAGLDAVLIDRAGRHAGAPSPRISSLLELVQCVRTPA